MHPMIVGAQGMGGDTVGMRGGGGNNNASGEPPLEQEKPAAQFNPFEDDAPPVEGLESKIAALERVVFGHAETNPKMKVRVQRLEKRLVPYERHSASEQNLEKRVNHLWSTVKAGNKNSRFPGTFPAGFATSGTTLTGNTPSRGASSGPKDPGADLDR